MTVEVRVGGADDVGRIEPLWRAMVDHHAELTGHEFPIRDRATSWAMRRAQYQGWLTDGVGELMLATTAESAILGYAFVRWHASGPTWDFGPVVGELESLAVAADARGQGVGSALLDAGRAHLRARGIEFWSVDVVESNAALRLYERAGFRPNYRTMYGRL